MAWLGRCRWLRRGGDRTVPGGTWLGEVWGAPLHRPDPVFALQLRRCPSPPRRAGSRQVGWWWPWGAPGSGAGGGCAAAWGRLRLLSPRRRRGRARSEERGAELGDTRQQPLHLCQPPRAPAGAAGAVSWGPGLGTQPGCSGTQWSLCRPRGGPPCVQARKGFVSIKGWKRPKLSSRSPR